MDVQVSHCLTNSNLNHTGVYVYSKGKIMIHLTFDYRNDEKCQTPGEYLRYHRTLQGKTTREVAENVGIVPATLVLYENDKHPIKHKTAVSLADELNIDLQRLLDTYTAFVNYPCGAFLREVRKGLKLPQAAIARDIGISQTAYSGWERGVRVPRRQEYPRIIAGLKKHGVDVERQIHKGIA